MALFTYHTNYTMTKTQLKSFFHLTPSPPPNLPAQPSDHPSSRPRPHFSQQHDKLRTSHTWPFLLVTDTRVIKDKKQSYFFFFWKEITTCMFHFLFIVDDDITHVSKSTTSCVFVRRVSTCFLFSPLGSAWALQIKWYNLPSQMGAVVSQHYTIPPRSLSFLRYTSKVLHCFVKIQKWFL